MAEVRIPVTGAGALVADLGEVAAPRGVVLFAHGSGSGRHSPRNRYVAEALNDAGLVTVLADLLTPDEERADARSGRYRFDIGLLAGRMIELTDWATRHAPFNGLGVGLFGASTGAAAALVAAAARPSVVRAVVSRGGRPDLAGDHLAGVRAPTLLIVGGHDDQVLALNRQAKAELTAPASLHVVPGATHLFAEPGALEQVARLAADFFRTHLVSEPPQHSGPG